MRRILKHIIKGYTLWLWYYLCKSYRDKQKLHIIRANSKSFLTVKKVEEILKGRKFDFILIDGGSNR